MIKGLYEKNRAILQQTAKALLNKNQVYDRDKYLLDPQNMEEAIHNYNKEVIKNYSCSHCGLSINCPRQWIRAHIKKCANSDNKSRENEMLIRDLKPYWY